MLTLTGISHPSSKAFFVSFCPFGASATERDVAVCSARSLHTLPGWLLLCCRVGGGGSITQELSHNQNSGLARNSTNTSGSVVLFRHFPLTFLKKNVEGKEKHPKSPCRTTQIKISAGSQPLS